MELVVGTPLFGAGQVADEAIDLRAGTALQTRDDGIAHLAGEERVFAVGLLATSPARVAEDVDIRCPDGQSAVALDEAFAARLDVLDALFGAGDVHDLMQEVRVERGCHADGLREDSGHAAAGGTVQGLAPPVVFLDAQFGDGAAVVHHQGNLLLEGETAQEVAGTHFG